MELENTKDLNQASLINRDAAIESVSVGLFQILGQNYKACSCSSPSEFWKKMCESEFDQFILGLSSLGHRDYMNILKIISGLDLLKNIMDLYKLKTNIQISLKRLGENIINKVNGMIILRNKNFSEKKKSEKLDMRDEDHLNDLEQGRIKKRHIAGLSAASALVGGTFGAVAGSELAKKCC